MKFVLPLLLLLTSLLSASCGKKLSEKKPRASLESLEPEGIYTATLNPINYSSGKKQTVVITKYGDEFKVKINFKNGPDGIHRQGLYTGSDCPNSDINGDGFIDMVESESLTGKLLLPFDGDLSAVNLGSENYPATADYHYENSTSFQLMVSDLPKSERNLKLAGRIVIIQGMKDSEQLPIACGILSQSVIVPNDEELDPPRVRPRPSRPPHVGPQMPPDPPPRRTLWQRLRDRIGGWWWRLRGGGRKP